MDAFFARFEGMLREDLGLEPEANPDQVWQSYFDSNAGRFAGGQINRSDVETQALV